MTKAVDFFDDFSCLKDKCPYTCCRGWGIMIDEDTYDVMKKERSLMGVRLRLFTCRKKNDEPHLRMVSSGRCPFYTTNHLCGIQCAQKEDLMPKICRIFPRRCIAYKNYKEASLELACYEAASLFISRVKRKSIHGPIQLVNHEDYVEPYFQVSYVDDEMFPFFLRDREKILHYWMLSDGDLAERWRALYAHTYTKQRWLFRDDFVTAESLHIPLEDNEAEETRVPKISKGREKYAFYPLTFLNDFIYGRLTESCTKSRNPLMFELIKAYKKQFGSCLEQNANASFEQMMDEMLNSYPYVKELIENYFFYILMQSYFEAQSDCYILSPVLHSILYTEFLMLFCGVAYRMGKVLEDTMLAGLLCSVEKAVRHSPSFSDQIMEEIRERFFTNL